MLFGLAGLGALGFNLLHHVHPLKHLAKDNMLAIEVRGRHSGNEELASIGVRSRVGHAEGSWLSMLQCKAAALISKLLPIDAHAPGAIPTGEIATLDHEPWDNAVESGVLELELVALLP